MDVTLKYCEVVTFSITAGSTSHQAFRANSIYDPNLTGTGHQPLGRDQLAEMYDHYEVLSSQCHWTVCSTVYSAATVIAASWLDDDGSTAGSIQTIMEQPTAVYRAVSNYQPSAYNIELDTTYNQARDLSNGLHAISDMGGNPPNQMYHMNSIYSAVASTFDLVVRVTYRVRFSSPKEIATS
jgi:hypothetical protein